MSLKNNPADPTTDDSNYEKTTIQQMRQLIGDETVGSETRTGE